MTRLNRCELQNVRSGSSVGCSNPITSTTTTTVAPIDNYGDDNSTGYMHHSGAATALDSPIRFSVFDNYNSFDYGTCPQYPKHLQLPFPFTSLPDPTQQCVMYAVENTLIERQTEWFYLRTKKRDEIICNNTTARINNSFVNYKAFYRYCVILRKMDVVRDGWLWAFISITMSSSRIWTKATGCNK